MGQSAALRLACRGLPLPLALRERLLCANAPLSENLPHIRRVIRSAIGNGQFANSTGQFAESRRETALGTLSVYSIQIAVFVSPGVPKTAVSVSGFAVFAKIEVSAILFVFNGLRFCTFRTAYRNAGSAAGRLA
jgi:hypothetical protein